jgi:hypothetical protein
MSIMNDFFVAPFDIKVKMLKELANDTDDALWQSEQFLRIKEKSKE